MSGVINRADYLKSILYTTKNNDLNYLVYALCKYRINKEGFDNLKVLQNIKIKGKSIDKNIGVCVEFRCMNNIEHTLIKTFDRKFVTSNDI